MGWSWTVAWISRFLDTFRESDTRASWIETDWSEERTWSRQGPLYNAVLRGKQDCHFFIAKKLLFRCKKGRGTEAVDKANPGSVRFRSGGGCCSGDVVRAVLRQTGRQGCDRGSLPDRQPRLQPGIGQLWLWERLQKGDFKERHVLRRRRLFHRPTQIGWCSG